MKIGFSLTHAQLTCTHHTHIHIHSHTFVHAVCFLSLLSFSDYYTTVLIKLGYNQHLYFHYDVLAIHSSTM